jgi:polar amino acid transport system substrate-binding protein
VGRAGDAHQAVCAAQRGTFATLAEARKLDGILLPREFYSYDYLAAAGFTNLEPVATSRAMLTMLLAGRRPAMVTDSEQLDTLLKQAGVPAGTVVPCCRDENAELPDLPPDTPEALGWRQALEAMKQDGTFTRLQKQWLHR